MSMENRESKPVLLKHREKKGSEIVSRLNVLIPSQQFICTCSEYGHLSPVLTFSTCRRKP